MVVDCNGEDGKAGRANERHGSPAVLGVDLQSEVLAGEWRADVVGSRGESGQVALELRSLDNSVAGGDTSLGGQRGSVQDFDCGRRRVGSEEIKAGAELGTEAVQRDGVGASPVDVGLLLNLEELVEGEAVPV